MSADESQITGYAVTLEVVVPFEVAVGTVNNPVAFGPEQLK